MRSDNVTKGAERAPNRSLFYAMGYTKEELERPLIGVVSAHSEIVPGHAHLDKIADAVKAGIRMAGGTPVLVPSIGVCDGIAMGHIGMKYSLASRELIADSVETMTMAHQLDGLVLVPNCDKIVPGMVMAAVSMNLASALSNYTPADGDYIKSQNNGFAQYYESLGWCGTLNSLSPGQGYMYQNTSGMVKTLIYPEANAKAEIKANITSENNYWVVDDTKYPTNMSVIAVVENDGMEMKNYEIGVFSDDECRGSARPIYIEELDSHIIFLTVYGVGGETIKFRYYDVDNAECYDIDNTMVYSVNATIGDIAEPYVMNFIPANVNEMSENEVRIYPNPVNRNSEIYFDAECERVEVYNALGVMVSGYENVNHINGLETSGVYMIKITKGDAIEYNRVVVR